jgi:hypothetical protein
VLLVLAVRVDERLLDEPTQARRGPRRARLSSGAARGSHGRPDAMPPHRTGAPRRCAWVNWSSAAARPVIDERHVRRFRDLNPEIRRPGRHQPDEERRLEQDQVPLERRAGKPNPPADDGHTGRRHRGRHSETDGSQPEWQQAVATSGRTEGSKPASERWWRQRDSSRAHFWLASSSSGEHTRRCDFYLRVFGAFVSFPERFPPGASQKDSPTPGARSWIRF